MPQVMSQVLPIRATLRPQPLLQMPFIAPLRRAAAHGVLAPACAGGDRAPARLSWVENPETDWPPGAGVVVVLCAALLFWGGVAAWVFA